MLGNPSIGRQYVWLSLARHHYPLQPRLPIIATHRSSKVVTRKAAPLCFTVPAPRALSHFPHAPAFLPYGTFSIADPAS